MLSGGAAEALWNVDSGDAKKLLAPLSEVDPENWTGC
jgi:hypothetical protein